MIEVENLEKDFFVPHTVKGPFGAVKGLFRRTGITVQAVRNVSFCIAPGEFVGYVGPNGAGKSTTIKMLTGVLHQTRGSVSVLGMSPQRERTKVVRHLGVVFGQRTHLWWDLPLIESFELLATMYGVTGSRYKEKLALFSDLFGLASYWDNPVRKLSLGQRMRGEIAAALLHSPQILLLDEPTIGLDVVARGAIRGFLQEVNKQGVTVLLTTHDLADVERLCNRVMVINHGEILFDGKVNELKRQLGDMTKMIIDFEPGAELAELTLPEGCVAALTGGLKLTVSFERESCSPNDILRALNGRGVIRDIHIKEPDIETTVAKLF